MLRQEIAATPRAVGFQAEAKTTLSSATPNVVQAYTVGERGAALSWSSNTSTASLRRYLAKNGPPGSPLVLSIMRQVAAARAPGGRDGHHPPRHRRRTSCSRKAEAKVADSGWLRLTPRRAARPDADGHGGGHAALHEPGSFRKASWWTSGRTSTRSASCYDAGGAAAAVRRATAFEVAIKHVREEAVLLETVRPGVPAAVRHRTQDDGEEAGGALRRFACWRRTSPPPRRR